LSDFEAPSIGSVATFDTTGLIVGNTLSFDISTIFNAAVGVHDALGIRLRANPEDGEHAAIIFDNFRLTSSASPTGAVPEPWSALVWTIIGMMGLIAGRRVRNL
jgi:hypothetical protein